MGRELTLALFPLLLIPWSPVMVVDAAYTFLNTSGDIMLGGLFPVHTNGKGVTECGGIQVEEGLQMLEAMLFIVNEINENEELLPGIKLGVIAYDTCDSPAFALEQSLDFIKGFIAHFNANEFHTDHPKEFVCEDGKAPLYRGGNFDKVVAILGEQSSTVTMQMATMLRLFGTPIVSYMATSPALSNKDRFPTFFRTVPSDVNQANAMLELIRRFNWTYVSIVYSDSEYGNQGYETLQELAPQYGVCFSTPLRVSKEHFSDADYDRIVQRLANNTDARVVVVFAEKPTVVLRLVESTRRMKVGNRFVWVGSHGWTVTDHTDHHLPVSSTLEDSLGTVNRPNHRNRQLTKDDLESHEVLEGALAIQPLASHLMGFDEYLGGLTVENHEKVNPWFKEYLEAFFHCSFSNRHARSVTESSVDCDSRNLTISVDKGFQQHSCLHFVRDAVYAVATALHNMHRDKCGGTPGLCPNMSHIENSLVVEYLKLVTFKVLRSNGKLKSGLALFIACCIILTIRLDEKGNPFRFLDGRDGPPRYSILNFQRTGVNAFQWQIIGNYTLDANGTPKLFLDNKKIRFREDLKEFPSSNCTQTCDDLQIRIREYDDVCCWSCINCSPYEIKVDDFHCKECKLGELPSRNKSVCIEIPEDYINYMNPWAMPALVVATVGISATTIISYVFWENAETPVVKASGRELSYLLLFGTFLEFWVTYIMVAPPTFTLCVATRFFLGFSFTLCYAAIVTKTNRIARIFNSGGNIHRTRCISPKSQVLITTLLTSVQIFINIGWFLYDPPFVSHIFPSRDSRLRVCSGLGDFSYLIGLSYPFVLIGVCTVYAFLTRKCPDGFNEARHIGFTNYTAIIIWLAFVPLYIASTSYTIRVVTLAMSLSLSGFVQLGCLFLPKLYIVVFTPEKNTKELVMAHNRTSSFSANTLSSNMASNNTDLANENGYKNPSFTNSVGSINNEGTPRTIRFHPVISVAKSSDDPVNDENVLQRPVLNRRFTPPHRKTGICTLPG